MGRTYDRVTDQLRTFVERQHLFFVATAPLAADGHVNVSPKGGDTLRILDDRTLCYLDITGSGVETIAHLRENGRITIMCCAFEGPPNILRLQGRGRPVVPGDDDYDDLLARFAPHSGVRAVVVVTLDRISTSCGFAVPLYDFVGDRDRLEQVWAERGPEALPPYWAEKNAVSIDGLPGLPEGALEGA